MEIKVQEREWSVKPWQAINNSGICVQSTAKLLDSDHFFFSTKERKQNTQSSFKVGLK